MGEHRTCRSPDRDCAKMICGYTLPCPWHTTIVDTTVSPVTVTIPVTSDAMESPATERLGSIGRALSKKRRRCT